MKYISCTRMASPLASTPPPAEGTTRMMELHACIRSWYGQHTLDLITVIRATTASTTSLNVMPNGVIWSFRVMSTGRAHSHTAFCLDESGAIPPHYDWLLFIHWKFKSDDRSHTIIPSRIPLPYVGWCVTLTALGAMGSWYLYNSFPLTN